MVDMLASEPLRLESFVLPLSWLPRRRPSFLSPPDRDECLLPSLPRLRPLVRKLGEADVDVRG